METLEPVLAEHPFFKDLDESFRRTIVGCATNVRFAAGDIFRKEGDEATECYIIRHGRVSLESHVPGRGALTVQTLGPGDILGLSWLVPPYKWRFDARAVELTRAIVLEGDCLRRACEEDHELGFEMLRSFLSVMSQRLEATRLQLMDVYGTDD